jgi:hypothetical protein
MVEALLIVILPGNEQILIERYFQGENGWEELVCRFNYGEGNEGLITSKLLMWARQ